MTAPRAAIAVLAPVALLGVVAVLILRPGVAPERSTPVHDPPVLAGQQLWGPCAGGFYARLDDEIVLTSSGHCASEGTVAYAPGSVTVRGVFGPSALEPTCPHEGKKCKPSDMNYMVVAPDQIPWGQLNLVDLGAGGYRSITARTAPLACHDIEIGDEVEINGRNIYRIGAVAEKGEYLHEEDGDYFPCIVAARVQVGTGDSGGAVLVGGVPGGVTSRSFGGLLGFTPLAEGLASLGLDLCTTPDCNLVPP